MRMDWYLRSVPRTSLFPLQTTWTSFFSIAICNRRGFDSNGQIMYAVTHTGTRNRTTARDLTRHGSKTESNYA